MVQSGGKANYAASSTRAKSRKSGLIDLVRMKQLLKQDANAISAMTDWLVGLFNRFVLFAEKEKQLQIMVLHLLFIAFCEIIFFRILVVLGMRKCLQMNLQ